MSGMDEQQSASYLQPRNQRSIMFALIHFPSNTHKFILIYMTTERDPKIAIKPQYLWVGNHEAPTEESKSTGNDEQKATKQVKFMPDYHEEIYIAKQQMNHIQIMLEKLSQSALENNKNPNYKPEKQKSNESMNNIDNDIQYLVAAEYRNKPSKKSSTAPRKRRGIDHTQGRA